MLILVISLQSPHYWKNLLQAFHVSSTKTCLFVCQQVGLCAYAWKEDGCYMCMYSVGTWVLLQCGSGCRENQRNTQHHGKTPKPKHRLSSKALWTLQLGPSKKRHRRGRPPRPPHIADSSQLTQATAYPVIRCADTWLSVPQIEIFFSIKMGLDFRSKAWLDSLIWILLKGQTTSS